MASGSSQWRGPIADAPTVVDVVSSEAQFRGRVVGVRSDTVKIGDSTVRRDIVVHPGAVGIIAINDADEILLLRQLRVPVSAYLFEPPAGLLDKVGEDPLVAAKRELVEEAGLVAATWHVLVDVYNTPGGSTEAIRVYLARDLSPAVGGRPWTGEAEEFDLPTAWVPLAQACRLVFAGDLMSPLAVIGSMAAAVARDNDWRDVRPADAPWPVRDHLAAIGNLPATWS